jgi:predicted AlkP superfamily pyrophosphatase or phosphodiesterase
MVDDGWTLATRAQVEAGNQDGRILGGAHGYDPALTSMQGLLIVAGPQFKRGEVVPPIENIHLYDLMARVLGLTPAPNDGGARRRTGFFRE